MENILTQHNTIRNNNLKRLNHRIRKWVIGCFALLAIIGKISAQPVPITHNHATALVSTLSPALTYNVSS